MTSEFVHLHNHTDYSLLDAAQSVEMMCDRVAELGMDSIAVTEHGNLFSMIPFYKEARKKGVKPIIGCEVYVSIGDHTVRKRIPGQGFGYHHLVLIAQNETGYRNLIKLVSIGYLNGFYYRPRVDKKLLKQYNEGLICTSACLKGEVTEYAYLGDYENAKKAALEYSEIFPDNFYLEIQNHNIPEEIAAHSILKKLSNELNLPLIATNDCHYARREHWEAHDILFCLGTQKMRNDTNRQKYEPEQFYIKSQDEMFNTFKDFPGALENTRKIADLCDLDIPMGTLFLPKFPIPNDTGTDDPNEYLKQLCRIGIREKYPKITEEINHRLEFELGVIKKMGYAGYFLIVMDFVRYAKDKQIPVGPGRGSAASSLVAYATGITDVDPIKYNLLFERFLNPDRISMPDIDIDFCMDGRQKVIDYIKDRYGESSVSQIITFGRMKAKLVVRDVGRVLGMSYDEVDRIAKLIPEDLKMTLDKAIKMNKDLSGISKKDELHKNLIEYSRILEGLHRHSSVHAAGVVITPGPLTDYIPLYKSPSAGEVTTQVDMNGLEDLGLLKMDFLGLRTLTVIDKAIRMICENHNEKIDIEKLELTDKKTFKIFASGKTVGIFQFESGRMRDYLKKLNPTCIEDLIAMNALHRPGPMENIPEFIDRKHGKKKITYLHPSLEPLLKETHGIIVYQEQVMQIASEVAGFSLAEADKMRRAMGKKKADEMAAVKVDFVEGAEEKGFSRKLATEIFDLVERFAQYGFNKSHSTAYAIVAYRTGWLKAHYPAEFLAAAMTTEMNKTKSVVSLIEEAKSMGIAILPPDVNASKADFTAIDEKTIAYGLAAIKNVGYKISDEIDKAREKTKLFTSVFDLCKYFPSGILNKKVLESLILSGACDSLSGNREQCLEVVDTALKFGQDYQNHESNNQANLFGGNESEIVIEPQLPDVQKWTQNELLAKEKEILGFYLTGDPLADYNEDIMEFSNFNVSANRQNIAAELRAGGIITDIKVKYDKKNNPWAIVFISNNLGKVEVFTFSSIYEKYSQLLEKDKLIFVIGNPSNRSNADDDVTKIIAEELFPLEQTRRRLSNTINVRLNIEKDNNQLLNNLKEIALKSAGNCGFILHLAGVGSSQKIRAGKLRVTHDKSFISTLREMVGEKNVWIN